jgi:nitrite reductase/ring-hydroxylating ferredoxin subunit
MMRQSVRAALAATIYTILTGCGDSFESSIPEVSFSLTYNTAVFPTITIPGQFVKIEKNVNGIHVGYAGVILGKSIFSQSGDNEYVAFDAACPVEASRSTAIDIVDDGLGTAVCPVCGTIYNLSNGGYPEGKGTEYLKRYSVTVSGTTLHVGN